MAVLVIALAAGCGRDPGSGGIPSPPGLVVGARISDIRMFEFDRQSRVTLVDGDVVAIEWPWVLVGSRADTARARFWVNFNHVCSFRLEE
ncbi:MAG: hypothetical protein L6Q95_08140 [Planctomycetes bacterium]|nr:hypothetical protein [Planctomycetota bacterium]